MALALAPAVALAQDDMGDDMAMSMVPHPSHIHSGLCPAPGDVVAALSDVTVVGNDAEGVGTHIHVDIGVSTVDLSLEDILAADHSIVVHNSADDMGTYISCGNIGGHDVDGTFLVGMGPVGDSQYSGIARITDNGDGTSGVSVSISQFGPAGMMDEAIDPVGIADGEIDGDEGTHRSTVDMGLLDVERIEHRGQVA